MLADGRLQRGEGIACHFLVALGHRDRVTERTAGLLFHALARFEHADILRTLLGCERVAQPCGNLVQHLVDHRVDRRLALVGAIAHLTLGLRIIVVDQRAVI